MSTVITEPMGQTIYGLPSNTTFADVWNTAAEFSTAYKASGLYDTNNTISDDNITRVYYLIYSRYGNNSIASRDLNRWKYNVFDIIYQYGPSWEAKLNLQKKIRNLTDAELQTGTKAINNHAYNPGTVPSTAELSAINEQNTQSYTKNKLDAYTTQWSMIENDVTEEFLGKFKRLFAQVAAPLYQLGFPVEEE